MVNQPLRERLMQHLKEEEKREMFFYEHFTMEEKTTDKSKKFIDKLVKEHYEENNQVIPFAKIDGGYIQTIINPYVECGFIAVQVVTQKSFMTPNYTVDNTVFHVGVDPTE